MVSTWSLLTATKEGICVCGWVLTLKQASAVSVNKLDVVNPLCHWGSSADQPQLITDCRDLGYFFVLFSAAGQFLYMKAEACVTGRADGKPERRGEAGLLYNVQRKFPKGQLLSLGHFFFLPGLELCLCSRVIENIQWVEVLRKPPWQADAYLSCWPLRTHCAAARLVVMDPFNSTPQSLEVKQRPWKHIEWVRFQPLNPQLSIALASRLAQGHILYVYYLEWKH